MEAGFVELCVADAGAGFIKTLRDAFDDTFPLANKAEVCDEDILAFAFDIYGTCKSKEERWATERHVLGRILNLVAKYGGVLTLRSGKLEVVYVGAEGRFERLPDRRGYRPSASRVLKHSIRGAHFQLVLPLLPIVGDAPADERPRLFVTLPRPFQVQPSHVRGHLVPLLESLDFAGPCVGRDDLRRFRQNCEALCRDLIASRPPLEPLVIDYSEVEWTAAQFETLLYLLQNLLQTRPVLLVEIKPELARDVRNLESMSERTLLDEEVANLTQSLSGRAFGELSDRLFMEAYTRVHSTILGIDRDRNKYMFGLLDHAYEAALLSLIDNPATVSELIERYGVNENLIRAILNNINPLFECRKGKWQTTWDSQAIQNEAERVMSRHFDKVAAKCVSWRGRYQEGEIGSVLVQSDTGREIFNLPWEEEDVWVKEFFESARVLTRERYLDEYAQRLVYRLRKGLELRGISLGEVRVLAAVCAPALLIASAIHRWWPEEPRPAVADLGYYLMLRPGSSLPSLGHKGAIVVVQDVVNTGRMSGALVELLRKQRKEVVCLLSLIRLVDGITATRVTKWEEGWIPPDDHGISRHTMIEMPKPPRIAPPLGNEDEDAFWVEPRSLRAFRYRTLRRGPRSTSAISPEPMEHLRAELYEPESECPFAAGHYVYGSRHYSVAIDIPSVLNGRIGDEIARWVADLCEGRPDRESATWETKKGYSLKGDVTAVLMPLHSQIHYIWPKVQRLLAQRGRRQPMWLLDATLFLGHGPAY